ncbi:hypothetical protein QVD99_004466 [Batrachochytrium dendrobatidis]|nr:hypothetical protein O5D80_002701 [Batrachochytrium dendrobatidis]KAK5668673.1 hypothetical protein QVD99_004466 [Batrachochytrium dendrobatidis]
MDSSKNRNRVQPKAFGYVNTSCPTAVQSPFSVVGDLNDARPNDALNERPDTSRLQYEGSDNSNLTLNSPSSNTPLLKHHSVSHLEPGKSDVQLIDQPKKPPVHPEFFTVQLPLSDSENDTRKSTLVFKTPITRHAKLAHLDGLRGIAALWVFFIHYLDNRSPKLLNFLLGYQSWKASVPIFFILSGRVLTVSVLRTGNFRQLASAIIRRPFRLLVPMYILIILDNMLIHYERPVNSLFELIFSPLWFIFGSINVPDIITGVVWTLRQEYYFSNVIYFTTFLLLQFQSNNRARYIIMGAMMAWFHLTHSWGTHFIAGLFIADLAQHGYIEKYRGWRFSPYLTAACFFGSMICVFRTPWFNIADYLDQSIRKYQFSNGVMGVSGVFYEENALIFLFCLATMFAIETSVYLQWFFSRSVFLFLGRISFPMYLIHHYTFSTMDWFNQHVKNVFYDSILTEIIIIVVPTLFLCLVSYILVFIMDNPSVVVGKWVERVVLGDDWSLHTFKSWLIRIPQRLRLDCRQCVLGWWCAVKKCYINMRFSKEQSSS